MRSTHCPRSGFIDGSELHNTLLLVALMTSRSAAEERLHEIAMGDLTGLGILTDTHKGAGDVSKLDAETYQLVQIAALAAIDGSPVSWLFHIGAAEDTHLDLEKVIDTLVAIAPIIGTPRVVSAGAKIMRVAGLADAVAAEDH